MVVYPEIESWNEYYPREIFIRLGGGEVLEDALSALKIANIGTTIYLGISSNETRIFKKIGVVEAVPDMSSSLILVGYAGYFEG